MVDRRKLSELSTQFSCEPKTVLKKMESVDLQTYRIDCDCQEEGKRCIGSLGLADANYYL